MKITIEVVPHSSQRYTTVGDWCWFGGDLVVLVSDLGNWKQEALVAIHELTEALLCRDREITTEMVDEFDFQFENSREKGNVNEPGDDILAPYWNEHQFASGVERLLAAELRINWPEYERKVEEL